jgi:hypothetical protein
LGWRNSGKLVAGIAHSFSLSNYWDVAGTYNTPNDESTSLGGWCGVCLESCLGETLRLEFSLSIAIRVSRLEVSQKSPIGLND